MYTYLILVFVHLYVPNVKVPLVGRQIEWGVNNWVIGRQKIKVQYPFIEGKGCIIGSVSSIKIDQ